MVRKEVNLCDIEDEGEGEAADPVGAEPVNPIMCISGLGSDADCEVHNMMACRKPYVRRPDGCTPAEFCLGKENRDAVTPFPCGNCIPCRINASREWTLRILLESTDHEHSQFITLTYEDGKCCYDDHMTMQLSELEFTSFVKQLRSKLNDRIRFFGVGEYGDDTFRPHYHLVTFGNNHIPEGLIKEVWKKGIVQEVELNEQTARYVAGYCMKKMDKEGDERLYGKKPEFKRSSRGTKKNGLGGLGRNAVRQIAEAYSDQINARPNIIREFRWCGQLYPLGRYLTKKLAEDIGIPDEAFYEETLKYQTELYTRAKGAKSNYYRQSILDLGMGKANSMIAKHKIFKQKRRF